jgi:hypothetical protein
MQPDAIMPMIYFSSETVPNECGRSNSKGGLIDNRIGIVRTRNACRMNVDWWMASSRIDRRQDGLKPNEQLRARPFADRRSPCAGCSWMTMDGQDQPGTMSGRGTGTTRVY